MMEGGRIRLISILLVVLVCLVVVLVCLSFCHAESEPAAASESEPMLPEPEQSAPLAEDETTPPQTAPKPESPSESAGDAIEDRESEPIVEPGEGSVPPESGPDTAMLPPPEVESDDAFDLDDTAGIKEALPVAEPRTDQPWQTEIEQPVAVESDSIEEEEDFWADFYVAGEEDYSIFGNGTYFVPLYVNDEYITDINATFTTDNILLDAAEFRALIAEWLIDSVEEELFVPGMEQLSLGYLNDNGIEAWYDYQTFELRMLFPTWMMPMRILSINRGNIARYSSYGMSGSTFLEPARFSWYTNLSMYSLIDLNASTDWQVSPASLFTMQSKNSVSVFDVAFDFSYALHPGNAYSESTGTWSNDIADYLTFQGIQGFYDFEDQSLRLLFGNVSDYLGLSTDSLGIALEKRYTYGTATPKGHQFAYEVVVQEPSIVEVFVNERSVYRRELQAGIYRLRDFVFTQGANKARVTVSPLANPSAMVEYEFILGYDSRLLSKGDTLYALSITLPEYDVERTIFRANQQIGLSNTVTASYDVAASPSAITLGLTSLYASPWGSFDVLVGGSYNQPLGFGFTSQLTYRVSGAEESPFGSFDLSLGFDSDRYTTSVDVDSSDTQAPGHSVEATASFSGRIGASLRYSASGSLEWVTDETSPAWRTTLSVGLPLIPNMSFNGSVSLFSGTDSAVPQVRGQVGFNYSLSPDLNVSGSSDLQNSTYVSASLKPFGSSTDSMQFSFSGIDFSDPLDHQGSVSYSHSAPAYGLSLRQQYADRFSRFTTSISLGTAFAFADGLFGITRNIGENFLLVKPEGAMKNGDLAVTRTMSSEPDRLPTLFGVGTYTAITTHQQNNVIVYSVGDSMLSSTGSFIYDFRPRPRQGYAALVRSETTYSVVGTLLRSPAAAYSRYAADLAKVETDEEGNETLVPDEAMYLFTDENGFFFVSGIMEGEYQFSLFLPDSLEEDPPVDIRFTIEADENAKEEPQVFVLDTFIASEVGEALEWEAYEAMMGIETQSAVLDDRGYYRLAVVETMDELTFWDEFYPKRMVLDSVSADVRRQSDAIVEFRSTDTEKPTVSIERMVEEKERLLFNLARFRSMVKPYLDTVAPLGWKPQVP